MATSWRTEGSLGEGVADGGRWAPGGVTNEGRQAPGASG